MKFLKMKLSKVLNLMVVCMTRRILRLPIPFGCRGFYPRFFKAVGNRRIYSISGFKPLHPDGRCKPPHPILRKH